MYKDQFTPATLFNCEHLDQVFMKIGTSENMLFMAVSDKKGHNYTVGQTVYMQGRARQSLKKV